MPARGTGRRASALSGCAFVARNGQRGTGLAGNGGTVYGSSLSADGRYVVFASTATNLVPGDTNAHSDVFLHDRNTGVTERVSVSDTEGRGNGDIMDTPSISDDGNVIACVSLATNLTPGCPVGVGQVFVPIVPRARRNASR